MGRTVARLRAAGCVFAEQEAELLHEAADVESDGAATLEQLLDRRIGGEPLETVLGWVQFGGRRWATARGVFVPRQRTQALAELSIQLAPRNAVAVDLCSGVGVLGAVLAWRRADVEVHCADIDPRTVQCARRNLTAAGRGDVRHLVHTGDLFEALPPQLRGRVTLVVANVPYVPTAHLATLPREAREYEDSVALDGGPDGLDVLRRVYRQAAEWVAVGGVLLSEAAPGQAPDVVRAGTEAGLAVQVRTDPEYGTGLIIARLG